MAPPGIRIARLEPEDIPFAARLAGQAFASDRQTQMKALGEEEPFDMEKYTLESMPAHLASRACHVIKAVDEATGEIMGVCNWGIRGFVPGRLPLFEERAADEAAAVAAEEEEEEEEAVPEAVPEQEQVAEEEGEGGPIREDGQEAETDPIRRMVALTDADMQAWMAEVMPPGTRCLFVVGLTVAPAHQGRGVGGALLRWGTRVCDEAGVFAWVHASDPSWGAYRKAGFEVVRSLDLDLDAYAPCPPPAGEGEGARWGRYVFRYMKYLPKAVKEEEEGRG